MIATLRPFARGWPRAPVFTIENEGRKREGFKNDPHSAAVCSWMAWGPVFTMENEVRKREGLRGRSEAIDPPDASPRIPSGLSLCESQGFHAGSLGRLCGSGLGLEAVVGVGGAFTHQSLYRQTPDPPP